MLAVGDPHGVSRRHLAAGQIGAITLVILGGTVLAGWFLDLEPLKSILPGYISMKVNTAIAFICAGGALTLILRNPRDRVTNLAAAVLGSGVFLIGFLTLTQYVFHVNLGIDELIVRDPHQLLYPGRVAPIAAVNFCFSGVALLLLARSKELAKWSQLLALATGFSALLGIVGYAYGVPVLYGSLGYTSMALHTGIGFVVLSAALLCCQPELGLMSVITAHNPGGWLSRRLIPIAVAVPPVAGALLLRFSASLGGMQMTIVAIVVLQVVLFVALTWVLSFLIERSETRVEIVEEQHVRTQEALSRSEELLRQSQKMEAVGQLAAGIAHDFNNLLSVIVGYSEILVQDPSTPEAAHKKLERIRQAGQSAASLTRQLLAFSRQELVQPKVLDVNAVIRYTEGVLRRLTKEDVQFELTLASNVHPIKADQGQIEQILMNLVVNASDAMPDGGKLRIQTSNVTVDRFLAERFGITPGAYVRLSVVDTGLGIASDVREHMFEPFYTTKPAGKGTGLGLATVYGIVQQNRGFIDVESTLGLGSAFLIYLPSTSEKQAEALSLEEPSVHPQGESVLVVEDDSALGDLVCESLQLHGFRTMLAATGPEALHLCRRQQPIDLVITDVIMPDMNGRELVQRLRELRPTVKIIFMSGYTNDIIIRQDVFNAGVSFIQKPFTAKELVKKIRQVLEGIEDQYDVPGNAVPPLPSAVHGQGEDRRKQ